MNEKVKKKKAVRAQCVTYVERRSRVLSAEVGVADMHSAYKNE
jgi:hypothetical protein